MTEPISGLMRLYKRLGKQALRERGVAQVWHEADIDGHHLYMADTSFGDGPIFRCDAHGWEVWDDVPFTVNTTSEDLAEALALAERAEWRSRFLSMQEEGATRQIWTAMVLSHDVDVCASILRGQKVLVRQLDKTALRRALRGAPLPADDEYIEVTIHMLAAIAEGGPPEVQKGKLALREPKRKG